jgi:hypothetical protein
MQNCNKTRNREENKHGLVAQIEIPRGGSEGTRGDTIVTEEEGSGSISITVLTSLLISLSPKRGRAGVFIVIIIVMKYLDGWWSRRLKRSRSSTMVFCLPAVSELQEGEL